MNTQSKYPSLRFMALTISILLVMALIVLASPSARSFAQSFIERVGGYGFSLGVPQPLDASRVPGPISIVRTAESVSIQITGGDVSTTSNAVDAGNQAGFAVLVPSYLPPGYTLMRDWYVITQEGGTVVTSDTHDTAKNMLFLNQWNVGEGELKTYTREQIIDVTVRGHNGVWLPDASSSNGDKALVWEENGITYSLIGNALALEEMLKVAESLGQ